MDAVRVVTHVVARGAITSVAVLKAVRDELRANVLAGSSKPTNPRPHWRRIPVVSHQDDIGSSLTGRPGRRGKGFESS